MQQPGWYTDPSGQPGRFRFWDGRAWTTATTHDPGTPWPPPATIAGAPAAASTRSRAGMVVAVVIALVLVLVLLGAGGLWLARDDSSPSAVRPTPAVTPAQAVTPTTAGTSQPVNCTGGNGVVNRRHQPHPQSTGVIYDSVPEWKFSFDPGYWTWMDDHTSLGAIRLDDGDNEAGITLGGIRFDNGFADQRTAGERTVACLEGTLSVGQPTRAGEPTTTEITLAGMKTFHTHVEFDDGTADALLVDIYVVDSSQGNKWAQIITFQRPASEAEPLIERALASVRHS